MKLAILISGRGSNMRAIVRAVSAGTLRAEVAVVISNVEAAAGLAYAREAGIETLTLPHGEFASRDAHDAAIIEALEGRGVELVCLAGYMRLLGKRFVQAFPGRILNIHPSLLPAFPGLDAQKQAFAAGVKVTGATVHIVDEELDHGPIVVQEAVPVLGGDDAESLAERILEVEHRLYPRAVRLMIERLG